MNRALLLKLLPRSRSGARLVGVVEVVDTGETTTFRDAEDLVALLNRIHHAECSRTRTAPTPRPTEAE